MNGLTKSSEGERIFNPKNAVVRVESVDFEVLSSYHNRRVNTSHSLFF